MEYVRIKSGATSAKMANREHPLFVEIMYSDTQPDGFLPVEKILPKPEPSESEELCYTYTNRGDRMTKEYFLAPKGTSFVPRKFSKLSIYLAITKLNAWAKVQSWLEGKVIDGVNGWMAFQLAQEVSEAHPLFVPLAAEAKKLLGLSDKQFEEMLNACILVD